MHGKDLPVRKDLPGVYTVKTYLYVKTYLRYAR